MQIDYVITWVDGQEPKHKAARQFYLEQEKAQAGGRLPNREEARHGFEKTTKIRFQDNGELYYNIASVLLYAPFIRKIFIVTDNQTPALLHSFVDEGLCPPGFLQLVSHDTLFAAGADLPQLAPARPSFNSRSIEAVLWRIPGLSEHFIFSNDDFFINAPVRADDFFVNGAPKLLGRWQSAGATRLRYYYRQLLPKFPLIRRRPGTAPRSGWGRGWPAAAGSDFWPCRTARTRCAAQPLLIFSAPILIFWRGSLRSAFARRSNLTRSH